MGIHDWDPNDEEKELLDHLAEGIAARLNSITARFSRLLITGRSWRFDLFGITENQRHSPYMQMDVTDAALHIRITAWDGEPLQHFTFARPRMPEQRTEDQQQ